jgi:hypothetical protein
MNLFPIIGVLALTGLQAIIVPRLSVAADARCGSYCLFVALKGLDVRVPDFEQFDAELGYPPQGGHSLQDLAEAAAKYGVHHLGVETSIDNLELRRQRYACLALLRQGHFVLISDFNDREVTIIDPPNWNSIPRSTVSAVWDGTALLLATEPLVSEGELRRPSPLKWYALLAVGGLAVIGVAARMFLGAKKSLPATIAACGLLWGGCNHPAPPAKSGLKNSPLLQLEQHAYDLGQVPVSKTRQTLRIPVRNRGSAPLDIRSVTTGCGCAGLGDYQNPLLPNVETALLLSLDCTIPGRRSANVVIDSNDAEHGRLTIPITWTPAGRFRVEPEVIELGVVAPESVHERTVRLVLNQELVSDAAPVLGKIICTPEELVACVTEATDAGYQLTVRIRAPRVARAIAGEVSVEMEGADVPEIRIPVRGRALPPVYAEPETLFLGAGGPDDVTEARVIVCTSGNEPVKISRVETSGALAGMSATVSDVRATRVALKVSFRRGEAAGVHKDVLKIEVESPIRTTLDVPIVAITKT